MCISTTAYECVFSRNPSPILLVSVVNLSYLCPCFELSMFCWVLIISQFLCRKDAKRLEEWASSKTAETIVSIKSGEGEVETILKDISQRAADGKFHYSRFFAIGLFRLLERANATDPTVLEQVFSQLGKSFAWQA